MAKAYSPAERFFRQTRRWLICLLVVGALLLSSPYPAHLWFLDPIAWLALCLGVGLRLWAVGYAGDVENRYLGEKIITAGPYAFIRHPRYLANALIGYGMALATGKLLLFFLLLMISIPILWKLKTREEGFFLKQLPESYKAYMKTTSAYLPLPFRKSKERHGTFSWEVCLQEREHKRALLWLTLFLLLMLRRTFF